MRLRRRLRHRVDGKGFVYYEFYGIPVYTPRAWTMRRYGATEPACCDEPTRCGVPRGRGGLRVFVHSDAFVDTRAVSQHRNDGSERCDVVGQHGVGPCGGERDHAGVLRVSSLPREVAAQQIVSVLSVAAFGIATLMASGVTTSISLISVYQKGEGNPTLNSATVATWFSWFWSFAWLSLRTWNDAHFARMRVADDGTLPTGGPPTASTTSLYSFPSQATAGSYQPLLSFPSPPPTQPAPVQPLPAAGALAIMQPLKAAVRSRYRL